MDQRKSPPPKSEWKKVHELSENGITIVISKLEGRGRPRFDIEVLMSRTGRPPSRHFSIFIEGQGVVKVQRIGGFIAKLVHDAEDWIEKNAQQHEDEFIARRLSKEQQQLDRDKPKPQMGLKALSKRDAAKKVPQAAPETPTTPVEAPTNG